MKYKTCLAILIVALGIFGYSEEISKEYYDLGAESQFITIFCHGFDNYIHDDPKDSVYGLTDSTFDESVANADDENQRNCMFYLFSNMCDHGSDDFIREIGDFSTGSLILREKQRQCFISLAKCEWVYRNCPKLQECFGQDFWWLESGTPKEISETKDYSFQKMMDVLLTNGPRYTDFFIANPRTGDFTYLAGLLKAGLSAYASVRGLTLFDDKAYIEIAKECYQLATGDYFDAAFMNRECIRGRKCPATIRFVTHSMGGMMVSKYVSEPESMYEGVNGVGKGEHGLYQRYLEYTDAEIEADWKKPTSDYAKQLGALTNTTGSGLVISEKDVNNFSLINSNRHDLTITYKIRGGLS